MGTEVNQAAYIKRLEHENGRRTAQLQQMQEKSRKGITGLVNKVIGKMDIEIPAHLKTHNLEANNYGTPEKYRSAKNELIQLATCVAEFTDAVEKFCKEHNVEPNIKDADNVGQLSLSE